MSHPIKLVPSIQHYDWGKIGSSSLVALLTGHSDDERPYAELWLGDHPKAPSRTETGEPLSEILTRDAKSILGEDVIGLHGPHLPFLLKILSIRDVLSIQAHPKKEHARLLRREHPEHYPDENHKPEMGIALTRTEILYGFKSGADLSSALKTYPELLEFLPEETKSKILSGVVDGPELTRTLYTSLIASSPSHRTLVTRSLLQRISSSEDPFDRHLLRFSDQYGEEDVGILSSLLLNHIILEPGEALYIGPNIPHAYVEGDVIECMAASDNVVRAGLTQKFRDEKTLLEMLEYGCGTAQKIVPQLAAGELHYPTPAQEFSISRLKLDAGEISYTTNARPVLLFALEGISTISSPTKGIEIRRGEALLVPAAVGRYTITCNSTDMVRVTVP